MEVVGYKPETGGWRPGLEAGAGATGGRRLDDGGWNEAGGPGPGTVGGWRPEIRGRRLDAGGPGVGGWRSRGRMLEAVGPGSEAGGRRCWRLDVGGWGRTVLTGLMSGVMMI